MAPRQYPYLDQVTDPPAKQTLRLLWDRYQALADRVSAVETKQTAASASITTLKTDVEDAATRATEAIITAGTATSSSPFTEGAGGAEGGVDDGFGAQGCASSGADGHVAPGSPLTAVTAGQIVCGTGKEWSALRAVTATIAIREANAEALLERMIWHLAQAGFTAGRQRNPSGIISKDKLTVQIGGTFRAYDVFIAFDDFTQIMPTAMQQVFPADYVASAGTAD